MARTVTTYRKRMRTLSAGKKKRKVNPRYTPGANMMVRTPNSLVARGYPLGPVPTKLRTVLRYSEPLTYLNGGAAGTAYAYVFSANGLYDPNISSTGHQPRGFDQFMGLYTYYVVVGVRATMRVSPNTSETNSQIVGLCPQMGYTALTDPKDYLESQGCIWEHLRPGTSAASKKLNLEVDVQSWFNQKDPLADDYIRGDKLSNPPKQLYIHAWIAGIQSVDPVAADCSVLLEYDTIFFTPYDVSAS